MATSDVMFDELLIEEVRKYPILYNYQMRNSRDKGKKANVWRDIAHTLHSNGKFLHYARNL